VALALGPEGTKAAPAASVQAAALLAQPVARRSRCLVLVVSLAAAAPGTALAPLARLLVARVALARVVARRSPLRLLRSVERAVLATHGFVSGWCKMPKYAREVDHGGSIRLVDIVDVPSHEDEDAWLSLMFAPQKESWVAAGEWFRSITQEEYENSLPALAAPASAATNLDTIREKLAEITAMVNAL
jgi:hypothetical protein